MSIMEDTKNEQHDDTLEINVGDEVSGEEQIG